MSRWSVRNAARNSAVALRAVQQRRERRHHVGCGDGNPSHYWKVGFAVGIAMVPCNCWKDAVGPSNKLHAFVAVSFFVSMALVCLFCANDTINLLPDKKNQDAFKRRYRAIGIVLLASPLAAVITSYALGQHNKYKFFIEAFGVWTFGYYWWTKSREFRITSAEKLAAHGMLENAPARGVVPVTK